MGYNSHSHPPFFPPPTFPPFPPMSQSPTPLTPEDAFTAVEELRAHDKDVGSPQTQIARLTARIRHLTEHMNLHPKDLHTRRGLVGLVNKRRRHVSYLRENQPEIHAKTLARLGLRK